MTSEKILMTANNLFHAYDIRIERNELDNELFNRLCDAEAYYIKNVLKTNKIIVSRDTRLKSGSYMQLAIDRFISAGLDVLVSLNPISTCQFYFSVINRPNHAGVMITASHNPPWYTGEKIVGLNCEPIAAHVGPAGGLDAIYDFFIKGLFVDNTTKGTVTVISDVDDYVNFAIKYTGLEGKKLSKIRIIADFMSGSSGFEIMSAFQRLGANITVLNLVPDGNFPSGTPNPIVRKNIENTLSLVERKKGEFDFLFVFDGDGDRIAIYNSDLEFISPSIIISYIANSLSMLPSGGIKVGLDSKSVPLVKSELENSGFKTVLIPNGHSLIKDMLKKEIISFAAEETAHYYLRLINDNVVFPFESTLLIALIFSSCWEQDRFQLDKLISLQKSIYSIPEWSYFFENDEKKALALEQVKSRFTNDGYEVFDKLADGSSLGAFILEKKFCNGWCRVTGRSSQSEKGLVRMMLYSSSQEILNDAFNTIEKIMKGV